GAAERRRIGRSEHEQGGYGKQANRDPEAERPLTSSDVNVERHTKRARRGTKDPKTHQRRGLRHGAPDEADRIDPGQPRDPPPGRDDDRNLRDGAEVNQMPRRAEP